MPAERKMLIGIGLVMAAVLAWAMARDGGTGQPRVQRAGGWDEGDQIAAPLTASARVQSRGRTVVFGLSLTDSKERRVRGVYLPTGRRPGPPRVRVLNEAGDEVYHCTLQYG